MTTALLPREFEEAATLREAQASAVIQGLHFAAALDGAPDFSSGLVACSDEDPGHLNEKPDVTGEDPPYRRPGSNSNI